MLNKFQEQYLLASVDQLQNLKMQVMININTKCYTNEKNLWDKFDKIISDIKSINPRLFSYPKVATYNTVDGKYPTAIIIKDD